MNWRMVGNEKIRYESNENFTPFLSSLLQSFWFSFLFFIRLDVMS